MLHKKGGFSDRLDVGLVQSGAVVRCVHQSPATTGVISVTLSTSLLLLIVT